MRQIRRFFQFHLNATPSIEPSPSHAGLSTPDSLLVPINSTDSEQMYEIFIRKLSCLSRSDENDNHENDSLKSNDVGST